MIRRNLLAALLLVPCVAVADPAAVSPATAPSADDAQIEDVNEYQSRFWPVAQSDCGLIVSVQNCRYGTHRTRLDIAPGQPHAVTISLMDGDKTVYSWKGHERTAFGCTLGGTFYYADFQPDSPGGTIVAINEKSGKELWRFKLEDIPGNRGTTPCSNRISLGDDGSCLIVARMETGGGCLEFIDFRNDKPKVYARHFYPPATGK